MIILGINAFHADSSAAIVVDGNLIAAVEEERFRRIKHWAGFPSESIRYCLREAGVSIQQVDHIAISRDPKAHFLKKAWFALTHRPNFSYLINRLANLSKTKDIGGILSGELGVKNEEITASIHHVEHHRAHMASAFFVSPFDHAAVVSVDALGDFTSTMWAEGKGNRLEPGGAVLYPHSLGFLYTAGTQFLGFPKYGDEYKVMGLAAYGEPRYLSELRKIAVMDSNGNFKLDLKYFRHTKDGVKMSWDGGEPEVGPLFSKEWEGRFGSARKPDDPVSSIHQDLAASLQAFFEECYFSYLNHVQRRTGLKALCLAGGCAMNSVANGKVFDQTGFTDVYVQSAAGDSGTAIGAAFYVWNHVLGKPRGFVMKHSYWGGEFGRDEIQKVLEEKGEKWKVEEIKEEDSLCRKTAEAISRGKVVGWFQGRMEWGARALGNRSIIADPRRAEMKDVLNDRIKRREGFRPFAPSILEEEVGNYFEKSYPDPFMVKVYPVKKEKRSAIPAVTHIDGSGRLQTVGRSENPRYWKLIKAFQNLTGIPVVLNTSFNENEPIVHTPSEAVECFSRTQMDLLVIGDFLVERE